VSESERIRGSVKWFNKEKGFGFISVGGKDIFVHVNNLPDGVESMSDGQLVSFQTEETKKGTRAIHVQLEVK
jgi:CspA family cold shock protein